VSDSQSPQDYFRMILLTVVEGAFNAAGYHLEDRRVQWAGGMFRFTKPLEAEAIGIIEFQHLHYAEGGPSRFTVTVQRTGRAPLRRGLAALVVDDFGVGILPSASHWWQYHNVTELGRALGEAGSLVVAYGMPWLAGELLPPK
jgi:hypothetical protein